MAARKKRRAAKKQTSNPGTAPNPNGNGAVNVRLKHLEERRQVRGREEGDGHGVDIGIAPGAFFNLEKHLKKLPDATRKRMLSHVKEHVDAAMKPLIKLVEREGDDYDVKLLKGVGPNMLRTVIEFLEEE